MIRLQKFIKGFLIVSFVLFIFSIIFSLFQSYLIYKDTLNLHKFLQDKPLEQLGVESGKLYFICKKGVKDCDIKRFELSLDAFLSQPDFGDIPTNPSTNHSRYSGYLLARSDADPQYDQKSELYINPHNDLVIMNYLDRNTSEVDLIDSEITLDLNFEEGIVDFQIPKPESGYQNVLVEFDGQNILFRNTEWKFYQSYNESTRTCDTTNELRIEPSKLLGVYSDSPYLRYIWGSGYEEKEICARIEFVGKYNKESRSIINHIYLKQVNKEYVQI